jgi:hypothetical protein
MKRHTTRDGWWEFVPTLRNREEFKTSGALWGGPAERDYPLFGELPYQYHDSAKQARYYVYSYRTPIAWENPDGTWTVPDVKYSVTTSRHQGKIRTAVANIESDYSRVNPPWASWNQEG